MFLQVKNMKWYNLCRNRKASIEKSMFGFYVLAFIVGMADSEMENMSWSDFVLRILPKKTELIMKKKRLYISTYEILYKALVDSPLFPKLKNSEFEEVNITEAKSAVTESSQRKNLNTVITLGKTGGILVRSAALEAVIQEVVR